MKKMLPRDPTGQFANTVPFQSLWLCLEKLESPSCIPKVPAINSFPESHPGTWLTLVRLFYINHLEELAPRARSTILYSFCLFLFLVQQFFLLHHFLRGCTIP